MKTTNTIFSFNMRYFLIFSVLLLIEIFIALWVRDAFIRPYGGDILAIILVYYALKSIIKTPSNWLVLMALAIGFSVEFAQYFHLSQFLKLQDYKIVRIIIGESFSIGDLGCYCVGAMICYLLNKFEYK